LERIPEPELMNEPEQARAYAEADFSEPHNMFVEKFAECFPDIDIRDYVLDLGCGPADISIRFAKAYPDCKIHGVDGAQQMLLQGDKAIKKAGLSERIKLIEGLLPEINLPESSYATIISNSLLHHLHQPEDLWTCIKQFGGAGTKVFVMDLFRPDSREIASELVKTYSGDEPALLQQDFFNSLCAAFRLEEVEEQLQATGLSQLQIEVISDRHMLVFGGL